MKPVIFADVDHGEFAQREAGVERADLDVTLSPGDFERLKEGRICPRCWEIQPEPFPDKCEALKYPDGQRGCGFPIKKQLPVWLEQNFGGDKWLGPTMTESDEDELFKERRSRAKREGVVRPSGLWTPNG